MSFVQDRRILYFFEAVRLGSVRAAADSLNVAPSAVSRHITQLEQELTTPLMERHRRGVKPTEAGEKVLDYYRHRLAQQEVLWDSLRSLQGLHSGSVTLSVGEGFVDALSPILTKFSNLYPKIELNVNVCGSNELIRQVVEDESHIGLVFNPAADPKLRVHVRKIQPLQIIVAPDHPLVSSKNPVSVKGLDRFRLALPGASFGIRQILSLAENKIGRTLIPTLTCNNIAMLKRIAVEGGVTLLPSFVVENEVKAGQLLALPLEQDVFNTPEAQLITRLGRQLSVGASRLVAMLVQEMAAFRD